jgi:hypothetical protein
MRMAPSTTQIPPSMNMQSGIPPSGNNTPTVSSPGANKNTVSLCINVNDKSGDTLATNYITGDINDQCACVGAGMSVQRSVGDGKYADGMCSDGSLPIMDASGSQLHCNANANRLVWNEEKNVINYKKDSYTMGAPSSPAVNKYWCAKPNN